MSLIGHSARELENALGLLWDFVEPLLTTEQRLELAGKHRILEELDEYGSRGPAGIGLGRCGGHAIGDD